MKLYTADKLLIRRGVGFTAPAYVAVTEGDENTINGIQPPKSEVVRDNDPNSEKEWEEPRCRS